MINFAVFCVVIVALFNGCAAEDKRPFIQIQNQEALDAVLAKCVSHDKLPEFVKAIEDGTYNEQYYFKKSLLCAYKEYDFITENGKVIPEKNVKAFAEKNDEMLQAIQYCVDHTPDNLYDQTETLFHYFKCFQSKIPYRLKLKV